MMKRYVKEYASEILRRIKEADWQDEHIRKMDGMSVELLIMNFESGESTENETMYGLVEIARHY